MGETRTEVIEQAKRLAIFFIDRSNIQDAFFTFQNALLNNPLTASDEQLKPMARLYMNGDLNKVAAMRKYIEDFK